jgi:hypothetical protein
MKPFQTSVALHHFVSCVKKSTRADVFPQDLVLGNGSIDFFWKHCKKCFLITTRWSPTDSGMRIEHSPPLTEKLLLLHIRQSQLSGWWLCKEDGCNYFLNITSHLPISWPETVKYMSCVCWASNWRHTSNDSWGYWRTRSLNGKCYVFRQYWVLETTNKEKWLLYQLLFSVNFVVIIIIIVIIFSMALVSSGGKVDILEVKPNKASTSCLRIFWFLSVKETEIEFQHRLILLVFLELAIVDQCFLHPWILGKLSEE